MGFRTDLTRGGQRKLTCSHRCERDHMPTRNHNEEMEGAEVKPIEPINWWDIMGELRMVLNHVRARGGGSGVLDRQIVS